MGQARGMKRALVKMVDQIAREGKATKDKILAISHCNCPERAREVERMLLDKIHVKDSFIVETAGISTMYANDGGILLYSEFDCGKLSIMAAVGTAAGERSHMR